MQYLISSTLCVRIRTFKLIKEQNANKKRRAQTQKLSQHTYANTYYVDSKHATKLYSLHDFPETILTLTLMAKML
jgi:hypothetical protein